MPILEYLKLLFYSVSDIVLMTLQKVLKTQNSTTSKSGKNIFFA